ncbi:MAG: hypothetical protein J6A75_07375 [Lachnospiraceae bacterium]|nr:hypothetical protein [Lachnospiraceae bacterium]
MIKSMALIAVVLGVLPFLLGMLYTKFVDEEKNNLLLQLAGGYVLMLGIFELVALPLIWLRGSLNLLTGIYGGSILVLAGISIILNGKRILQVITDTFLAVREFTLCIWAQLALIAGQVIFYIKYQYSNADDAFFVAAATTAIETNSIIAYNPYTGTAYESLPSRYVLSPLYGFNAVLSKVTDTHPAIMAHMIFMLVFLLLAYAVFALIGRALFAKNMEKTGYFLIMISVLHLFAAYSERTSGLVLLIRLWQGKAILAGVLLPMILYLAIRIFLLEGKLADWILLFFLMCACCMVSSMGIMLGAIMVGILGLLFAWKHKNIRILLLLAFCCLPNLLCAGIYLVIR